MSKVIHPSHYNKAGKRECWDEMISIFGMDAVIIFDCLNAYKYHYRKGWKDGNSEEIDAEKMENYMNHARKLLVSKTWEKNVSSNQIYSVMKNVLDEMEE